MAGSSNIFISSAEAKLIHLVNLLLIIERCDSTIKSHRGNCWYSRAILLTNLPAAGLIAYGLYKLFRPA